jgi:hypothetical protein
MMKEEIEWQLDNLGIHSQGTGACFLGAQLGTAK